MAAGVGLRPLVGLLLFVLTLFSGKAVAAADANYDLSDFSRSSFPPAFVFGTATAAYQVEGAAFEDGRGPSMWDTYTHKHPEKIADGSNGDVAVDMYHRYKGDIQLLKNMNLDAFRMSISWSRILPRGKLSGGVNRAGIAYYNNFINELLAKGITPYVTLFHWDVPQALDDEYKGFLNASIVDDFRDYVDVCFREFGDRVKNWLTLNEPFTFTNTGYDGDFLGRFAPGRCSNRTLCPEGDSATEPYVVAHNLLLSHGAAVKLYREKYQAKQKGEIGIVLVTHWFQPLDPKNVHDVKASLRSLDFVFGWFLHPVTYGNYPKSMISIVGKRLPSFTAEQSAQLKGSIDFLGLNYYTGNYAAHIHSSNGPLSSTNDMKSNRSTDIKGVNIGKPTGVPIFFVYPHGLFELLVYTKRHYNDPKIIITECGIGDVPGTSVKESTNDPQRIDFYNGHLKAVREAIKENVNVKGFFAWSFIDCFEWGSGYTQRFGLIYVDFKKNLTRIPKKSAYWVGRCLAKK